MTLVDLRPDGLVEAQVIAFRPLRQVRTLTGSLDHLLGGDVAPSEDFLQIVLTDESRRIDPMKRLWQRFPNACSLAYARLETKSVSPVVNTASAALRNPADLVGAFIEHVRGSAPSVDEHGIVAAELAELGTHREDAP